MKDVLGDELKAIEQLEAGRRAVKGKPLMARLDGRAFHTFTKGLARPYDKRMSNLMIDTTKFLVEQTHALIGYTQSDEISLCWYESEQSDGQYLFDGKYQKLTSVLASLATAYFIKYLHDYLPEKSEKFPTFDCRVWQVDSVDEMYLNFLWRQDDAIKNAISMAAQAEFSHKELQGVGSKAKIAMLKEYGVDFDAYPIFFKSGTFVRRETKLVELTTEQMEKIPEQHRPTGPVPRTVVEALKIGPLREYNKPKELLFGEIGIPKEVDFLTMCLNGEAVAEDVSVFIELWHNSEYGHGKPLHEALGMDIPTYGKFVREGDQVIVDILQERIDG